MKDQNEKQVPETSYGERQLITLGDHLNNDNPLHAAVITFRGEAVAVVDLLDEITANPNTLMAQYTMAMTAIDAIKVANALAIRALVIDPEE